MSQGSRSTFSCVVTTVNTLWGSDRVIRSIMFAAGVIAESPELSEDAREVCLQIKKAFSQARYISRIYGTIDSVDGLLHDLPSKSRPGERALRIVQYGVGGIGYHILEHIGLFLTLVRKGDESRMPNFKAWLSRMGLWDSADDIDAAAQWFWFLDTAIGVYFLLKEYAAAEVELKRCRKSKDAKGERAAKWRMINAVLDMSKSLTDLPLAVHYGNMTTARGGRGVLSGRFAASIGLLGSVGQLVSRVRKSGGPPL